MKANADDQAHRREGELLNAALELAANARKTFLDQKCAGNSELRRRLERLLLAHEQASSFLGDALPKDPDLSEPASGDRIGHYKLLQRIGEGGCGIVYMAEQEVPVCRRVALKIIKLGMDTKAVVARFEAERQALAMMDHPNIAKVLDAGTTESGRPYFVMELVRGTRITEYCDQNNLSTRERLELFIKVCQAIQHAHQKGIIHRDIKPSNILVTLHDGLPVPKVIDFGIAKATQGKLTNKTLFTAFEQFIGTPAYMSPEQAELSGLDIDTRSDIYSLGVLLYELLTGETPFNAENLMQVGLDEVRRVIREEEPQRPSTRLNTLNQETLTTRSKLRHVEPPKLIHLLRGDLDWITMKALEKDRTRRYDSAAGFAKDIERHLNYEPVTACPPSTAYRLTKFVRRNKLPVSAMAAVSLALILGLISSSWQAVRARRAEQNAIRARQQEANQRERAESNRIQAEHSRREALDNLYIANLNLAQADFDAGNINRMRELLEEAGRNPARGFEWYFWQRELHRAEKTLRGHTGPLRGLAISPDSKFAMTSGLDGQAKLWEIGSAREIRTFRFREARMSAFTPDGNTLAVAGDNRVIIWNLVSARELMTVTYGTNEMVWAVAFSPDAKKMALGFYSSGAAILDAATGKNLRELRFHPSHSKGANEDACTFVSFSRDGRRVLTAVTDGAARLWDANTGALLQTFDGQGGRTWAAEFSPDGTRIVTAHDYANIAKVWDTTTGALIHTLRGHKGWVFCAGFSPLGDRIYTSGLDQEIKVWDAESGRELTPLPKCRSPGVFRMAIAADGRHILTGSENGDANWWSVDETAGPLIHSFAGTTHGPFVFPATDSEEAIVLAATLDFTTKVFDLRSKRLRTVLTGHTNSISNAIASRDLAFVATSSFDYTARIWDARDGREWLHFRGSSNVVPTMAFSPDAQLIIVTSNHVASIWHLPSRKLLKNFDLGPNSGVKVWSPDGKWIAGHIGDRLTLWNAEDGSRKQPLEKDQGVLGVAWSPDSRYIAAGIWPSLLRIWDVSSGRLFHEMRGHRVYSFTVTFSPDGSRLLSGCQDKTAKLWDVASGRELLTLAGHREGVISVSFSANGRRIYTGSEDETMRVWETASLEEVTRWQREEAEAETRLEADRKRREEEQ